MNIFTQKKKVSNASYARLKDIADDRYLDLGWLTQLVIEKHMPLYVKVEYSSPEIVELDSSYISTLSGLEVQLVDDDVFPGKFKIDSPKGRNGEAFSNFMIDPLPVGFYEVVRNKGDLKKIGVDKNILEGRSYFSLSYIRSIESDKEYILSFTNQSNSTLPCELFCINSKDEPKLLKEIDFSKQLEITIKEILKNDNSDEATISELISFIKGYNKNEEKYPEAGKAYETLIKSPSFKKLEHAALFLPIEEFKESKKTLADVSIWLKKQNDQINERETSVFSTILGECFKFGRGKE